MDAVHLMRSITGRDLIIKIEGCYHGHHDSVQVSVAPEEEDAGPQEKPSSAPSSSGIPKAITDLTLIATFNDLDSVARLLDEHQGQIAGMILEPVTDERRDHQARARLPREPQGPPPRSRRAAHLRRG